MKKTRLVTIQSRVTEEEKLKYTEYCKFLGTTKSDHLRDYVLMVISEDFNKSNVKD